MPIYMNYNALAVKGDVTADGHKEWIELGSFQWGVGRGIASPTGASADRESSAPSISEVTITKAMDKSTFSLLDAAYQGEGVVVQIDFCKTDKGNLVTYVTFTLTNTMISGYSVSSGGDQPSESLSLNFTKIEYKYLGRDALGVETDPVTVTYDLALAKVV